MAKRKPNIVDILIIVVVVALCAVAVFKFGVVNQKESAGVDDSEEQRTYTALIDEVRMATVNALHEGDKIYDEKTGICLGTITAVKHEPFLKNVLLNDGTIQPVEFPDYYSVTLTIDGPGGEGRGLFCGRRCGNEGKFRNECSDKICETRNENHKHQRMSGG